MACVRYKSQSIAHSRQFMTLPLISPLLAGSEDGPAVLAVARQSGEQRATPTHRHARGQLLGASQGLLTVEAGRHRWVVPATHAVWVPPGLMHSLRSHGPFAGWSVYVQPQACRLLSNRACVLQVSGLLREAVIRAATWEGQAWTPERQRLAAVLLDEIRALPEQDLGLPLPADARLLRIAQALIDRPGDDRSLNAWAQWAGLAPRTLSRRYVAETGFSLMAWRQRVRLLRALELLAQGRAVGSIALELGYDNISAFIALFRREFGVTPGRWHEGKDGGKQQESNLPGNV